MIAVRLLLYVALCVLGGLAVFARCLLSAPDRSGWVRRALRWSVAGALLGSILWLPLVAAQMAGGPAWPIDLPTVRLLLGETPLGGVWLVRMALLATAALLLARRRRDDLALVAAIGMAAVATLAWGGHGAAGEGAAGWLQLAADIAHLVAAAIWVGALVGLAHLVWCRADQANSGDLDALYHALRGFGPIGVAAVATLVASGLVNGWFLVGLGAVGDLPASAYGRVLIAKLLLFGVMLALAALNRLRLTERFEGARRAGDAAAALRTLRASLTLETGSALAVLALVAWLGTLEPPAAM